MSHNTNQAAQVVTLPVIPEGMKAVGTSRELDSLAQVSPNANHPGYFDLTLVLGGDITTCRPMAIDFVPVAVQKLSGGIPYRWALEPVFESDQPKATPEVYFISDEDGYIKIGFANGVSSRLSTLQTANRQELKVLATVPGSMADEAALHRKFAKDRVRGEWFRPSASLKQYIKEVAK